MPSSRRDCGTARPRPGSTLLDVFPPLDQVGVALDPIGDSLVHGLSFADRGVYGGDVGKRHVDAGDDFAGMGIFFRKALLANPVVSLGWWEDALRVLQILGVELTDHPGRLPKGNRDPFLAIYGRLQGGYHAGGAALDELQFQIVVRDSICGVPHQAGTGLDADDLVAELVGRLIQLLYRVD